MLDQSKQTEASGVAEQRRRGPWDNYTSSERHRLLLILFLVGTSNYIDKNIIGVLLEPIKIEFQVSDTSLGLLSGIAFAFVYATLGIPVARWADRGDRKLIITLSLVVWSAMTALCGLAATFWQLAVARCGVGVGEAGAIPPAQSLLTDYFSPTQRARAIGMFMLSATAGYAVALVLGGWITQNFGWRTAFLAVALLGLALSPATQLLLKEPRRLAQSEPRREEQESVITALRVLLKKPAYRNIVAAIVAYFLMAYGGMVFIVSLMIRAHGLNVGQAGTTFGVISAVGACLGTLAGGALADRMATQDVAWYGRMSGWGMMLTTLAYELALCTSSIFAMVPLLLLSTLLMWGVSPAMYSALHFVCGSKRRAMAVAVAFFFANLIGLGLGPVITGSLSDMFAATRGSAEGLRYALMIVMTVLVPAGWCMVRAGQFLKLDAED